jgi:hypothetical protein
MKPYLRVTVSFSRTDYMNDKKPFSYEEGRLLKAALHTDRALPDERQHEAFNLFMREADKLIEDKPRAASWQPPKRPPMTAEEEQEYAALIASIEPEAYRRHFAARAYQLGWGLRDVRDRGQAASSEPSAVGQIEGRMGGEEGREVSRRRCMT